VKRHGSSLTVFFFVLAIAVWSTACQKAEPTASNANTAPANSSSATNSAPPTSANTNQSNAAAVDPGSTGTASTGTVSLATPTDAYKAAYTARKNKDIAALKRYFAKDALGFLTDIGKIDNKSLDEMLKEMTEKPQAASPETRNEKINGNRATLEYLDEAGKWKVMDFSKEGNDWKLDLPKGQ
jgi:flagellar hook-associated protein FlgK